MQIIQSPTGGEKSVPFKIMDANVSAVSAGDAFSLFLKTDGSLWGMGRNSNGQLGIGMVKMS